MPSKTAIKQEIKRGQIVVAKLGDRGDTPQMVKFLVLGKDRNNIYSVLLDAENNSSAMEVETPWEVVKLNTKQIIKIENVISEMK